jgi:hypothetical protein
MQSATGISFASLPIQLLRTFNELALQSGGNEGFEVEAILIFILDFSYHLRHKPDNVDINACEGFLEITCVEVRSPCLDRNGIGWRREAA